MVEEGRSNSSYGGSPCPICLDSVTQESYLDRCFHKFCYDCIVRWNTIVASKHSSTPSSLKCPMCKVENISIIYGYDGSFFQRHYVNKCFGNSEFFSESHRYRLKCYYTEPGNLDDKLQVSRYWKFRKYLQPNSWLHDWLRREIQAVMQEEDVDIIVHYVLGVIDSLRRDTSKHLTMLAEMVREEFRMIVSKAVKPFITGRTERFVNELELFLASGLTIDAFDEVYIEHLGWKSNETRENEQGETLEHIPAVPCLYIFDENSDEI
ncbi:uncharacterized protein [Primulina huaijiensis]|uniref:uncharacterized protein n=1 Tax=Primulina huaijiensis TaxID=1492673 RepID=UPI003CC78D39